MTLSRKEKAFLAAVLFYSFVATFGGLFRVAELAGVGSIAPLNPRAVTAPFAIVLHILSSIVFCIVGALQFLPGLRHNRRPLHRKLGYVVALSGSLSAATGLWMTTVFTFPPELQGPLLYVARILLGTTMLCLIAWGTGAARAGQRHVHAAAMIRAYAIGQGASTQAFFGLTFLLIFKHEPSGLERDVLMVSAWFANLLIAQIAIHQLSLKSRSGSHATA
ncbi:DUF2306 domain-containing protein [uncultured Roseobacter sp.]|uniref:DUF2306 domain-containing protein n=1 Tax=uncultured Roseobacter sp. TaxID=114847 RepID=UPI00262B142C|nr:DUF2306 domain-containing protein [uncultured Roseobacter sp.]